MVRLWIGTGSSIIDVTVRKSPYIIIILIFLLSRKKISMIVKKFSVAKMAANVYETGRRIMTI